jgi:hypothetical protein
VSSTQIVTGRPARAGPSQICWPPINMFPDGGTTRSTPTATVGIPRHCRCRGLVGLVDPADVGTGVVELGAGGGFGARRRAGRGGQRSGVIGPAFSGQRISYFYAARLRPRYSS